MTSSCFGTNSIKAARLWAHETERTYADRLLTDADVESFFRLRAATASRILEPVGISVAKLETRPLIFAALGDPGDADEGSTVPYDEVSSTEALRSALEAQLSSYNESNPAMDLVIFSQAAEHVSCLARVLSTPGGHAVMVGVGGSGKQSLARLAAHCAGCQPYQIQLTPGYGLAEFRADLLGLMQRCVIRSSRVACILTDARIVNDHLLVCINELLATGQVADIVSPEEKEAMISAVRAEVRASGMQDSAENCWVAAMAKVRRNLHLVLCFSPVGQLRSRARKFPALVGSCYYDWMRPWPREALESVAMRFLADVPALQLGSKGSEESAALQRNVAAAMATAHESAELACGRYLQQYRRYNYVTPKSYLELIAAYGSTLDIGSKRLSAARERLELGTGKISAARQAVEVLPEALKQEQVIVEEKQSATAALIQSIGKEKAVADEAVEASRGDEEMAAALTAEVSRTQAECAADLAVAEPVIAAAEAALNSLDKGSLGELKLFSNPSQEVVAVVSACMTLTAPGGAIPKDVSWPAGKKWMGASGSLDNFLKMLLYFDKDKVPVACVEKVEKEYLSKESFAPELREPSSQSQICGSRGVALFALRARNGKSGERLFMIKIN
jgi:dynein heavy chain, axonemal